MKISIEEVKRLAKLSALEFNEEELKSFVPQFNNILEMIDQIDAASAEDVLEYKNAVEISELREDVVCDSINREIALQNAPKKRKDCFNVPKVVD